MKELNKRYLRELRAHWGRYVALMIMIILGMYLVVSIAGMAETTIRGSYKYNQECNLQDGQFTTFIPLTDKQLKELSDEYGQIEKLYSMDLVEGDTTLRIFRLRKEVDLLKLNEGTEPVNDTGIVVMNLFAERNDIHVSDKIVYADTEFTVTGIGCVPDYNLTVKEFSDMTADPEHFGIVFVTDDRYDTLLHSSATSGESYTYAYKLKAGKEAADLKADLQKLKLDYRQSGDPYLIEYVDGLYQDKLEFEDGLTKLIDGTDQLCGGIHELDTAVAQSRSYFEPLRQTPYAGLVEITDGYGEGVHTLDTEAEKYEDGVAEFDEKVRTFLDDNYTVELSNLENFYENKDNPRIASDAASDVVLKKTVCMVAGAILVVLFAYVISVFIVHQIQEESSVIGTLYAMGVKRKTLIVHYILLPTVTTFLAGLLGMGIGFSPIGVDFQMQDSYLYYSLPQMEKVYPLYLIVYCVVVPPMLSALVNYLTIRKKLNKPALSLIKNEQEHLTKATAFTKKGKRDGNFLCVFAKQQLLREKRSVVTIIMGIMLSLIIFMIGLDCYVLCDHVRKQNKEDINYEYMYILKYPTKTVPKEVEGCYIKNLSMNYLDYSLDINIIGIDDDNSYYPFQTSGNKRELVLASSTAEKYQLKVGDSMILTDIAEDRQYAFTVSEIVPYSIGLTAYMDIEEMRELFGESEDSYNMLLSMKELSIENGKLYSVTTRNDIEYASGIFVDQMMSLMIILIVVSIFIFIVVMYLMLGVMLDRATFGISLVKIFGYRMREIRKVYLNGTFWVVAVGAAVGIPVTKLLADSLYPYFIANTAMGMDLNFGWYLYLGIFLGIMLIYLILSMVLTAKIKRIAPTEVLKNRE